MNYLKHHLYRLGERIFVSRRPDWALGPVIFLGLILLALATPWQGTSLPGLGEILTQVNYRIVQPLYGLLFYLVFTWQFALAIGLAIVVQTLIPARPEDGLGHSSFFEDAAWFFYGTVFFGLSAALVTSFLEYTYLDVLNGGTLTFAQAWPGPLRALLAFLVSDFITWGQHVLKHRIPLFWHFHAVHHSNTRLNIFTGFRVHLLDFAISDFFTVLPLLILNFHAPEIVAFTFFLRWYTHAYHANVRLNLGPLRYILVTPQSHRVHHALDPHFQNTNFGTYLSIWDHIFGTQHHDYDVYPKSGILDPDFPSEDKIKTPWAYLWLPITQSVYPFLIIIRHIRKGASHMLHYKGQGIS